MVKLALLLLAIPGVLACQSLNPVQERAIDAWLLCTDCTDHELDSLLAVANANRPATVQRLASDLLNGPSPARRANISLQLKANYQRAKAFSLARPDNPVTSTEAQWVSRYLAGYVVGYQRRAAFGLGHIGGALAKPPLDSVAALPPGPLFPPLVIAAARFARDSLWHPVP